MTTSSSGRWRRAISTTSTRRSRFLWGFRFPTKSSLLTRASVAGPSNQYEPTPLGMTIMRFFSATPWAASSPRVKPDTVIIRWARFLTVEKK